MADRLMRLSVVTPDGPAFEGDVRSIRFLGADGWIGVLPRHASMLSVVACGILHVVHRDGEHEAIALGEGFATVDRASCRFLVSFLNPRKDVDLDRAHGSMQRAIDRREEMAEWIDPVRVDASLCRAVARLQVCACGCDLCQRF